MKKKDKAIAFVKDAYGKKDFNTLQENSESNKKDIAEVVVRATVNEKTPKTLKAFHRDLDINLRDAGIVDNAIRDEIITKIKKTQFFRTYANTRVSDEELFNTYEDARKNAEKSIVVGKEVHTSKDHAIRITAANKIAAFKGIDTRIEDTDGASSNFQINIINPNDFIDIE